MNDRAEDTVFKLRWAVLLVMGIVVFGAYYAFDALSPIASYIISDMGITRAQYGLLFSYYSLPNLIMVLVGGILLDKIGIRKAGNLFTALCATGVLLTAAAPSFPIMLLGRFVFGLGAESLLITKTKILSKWFKAKELALGFALALSIARLGTIAAHNTSARIQALSGSWRLSIWVSSVIMFISFALFLVYTGIDKKSEKDFGGRDRGENNEKFAIQDIFRFKSSFWFISILSMTFYSAIFPFTAFSTVFLQTKFGFSAVKGGFYTSLIVIGSMVFTPLFGFLVDKFGKRATMMIFGSILLVPAHALLGLTSLHPAVSMVMLGFSFSLVPAALWPTIPLIIEEKRLGTAFGLMTLLQNIGMTAVPWLAGKITDISGGDYTYTMIMFASLGFVGLIFSLLLKISENKEALAIELPAGTA
ncbi:MAG: MFS transporter [Candidatus Aminicenantaceae bacterium]